MNTKRLRTNVPVLLQHLMKEYYLTTFEIAKIFKVKMNTVDNWVNGKTTPDKDIIKAMIFAYWFMKIYKPFRTFLRLIFFILSRTFDKLVLKLKNFFTAIKIKIHR